MGLGTKVGQDKNLKNVNSAIGMEIWGTQSVKLIATMQSGTKRKQETWCSYKGQNYSLKEGEVINSSSSKPDVLTFA